MRILLDNNVTHQLAPFLVGHVVVHARQKGWAALANGDLIATSEKEGFDALITADKGMLCQQNMTDRRIGILLIRNHRITIRNLRPLVPEILVALEGLRPGEFLIVKPEGYE